MQAWTWSDPWGRQQWFLCLKLFLSMCWFSWQALSGCYGGVICTLWKTAPHCSTSKISVVLLENFIFISFFFLQAPPIKAAPAEAENPTASASELLLWLHGPILISLVFFLHHLCSPSLLRPYNWILILFPSLWLHAAILILSSSSPAAALLSITGWYSVN